MRWPSCANMLQSRQHFSILVQRMRTPRKSPPHLTIGASNSSLQAGEGLMPWEQGVGLICRPSEIHI